MSTIMIYNDTAEFYLPDCETIWNYLSRFAKEALETGEIWSDELDAIYDNLYLLFGDNLCIRERKALTYNLEHIDGQLRGFKYCKNTKAWIADNMPTLERDEAFDSTEVLTYLYSFYKTLRRVVRWYGRDTIYTFSVDTTDII